ncbi:MAG: hypothetical protein ACR2PZ_06580 [Pseudomonadales bacterium]
MIKRLTGRSLRRTTVLCTLSFLISGAFQFAHAGTLIDRFKKAPIVADGVTAGRQTDFVIDLGSSQDPAAPGLDLAEGEQLRITLPNSFIFDEGLLLQFPICSLGGMCPSTLMPDACAGGTLACTTGVFLQGYPQSAIPPFVSRDGNTLIYTARGDTGPVIRNAHVIGKAIINPGPGKYTVKVQHVAADGEVIEEDSGRLHIVPKIRPSINQISIYAANPAPPPGFLNAVYQSVLPDELPLPWNYFVWDKGGVPFTGIELQRVTEDHYLLRLNGKRTVGQASIEAPDGASGFTLTNTLSDTLPNTPVIGLSPGGGPPPPTQRYEIQFDPGIEPLPGRYITTIRLNNGNSTQMFVDVSD